MSGDFDWTGYVRALDDLPPLSALWEQELAAELQRWIPGRRDLRVLEIGCSNGRWLRWFRREFGARTFGVDLNATRAAGLPNFALADGLRLPLESGAFDVVFSMGLVEHFPGVGLRRALLAEHVRAARPGGGLVWLEHPNMDPSLDWLYVKIFYDYHQGYRHHTVTGRETRRHLRALGVEILSARWLGWLPGGLLQGAAAKVRRRFRRGGLPGGRWLERKWFEHWLTADNFLVIGRRGEGR